MLKRYLVMWLLLPLFIAFACFEHGKEFCGDVWSLVKDTAMGRA